MVRILETGAGAQALARTLHEQELRLRALERSGQASHTSIDGGAIDIYDQEGQLKGAVGVQPDGGVALVPVNTDPPPTPMPPTVEPVLAGLVIGWDGTRGEVRGRPDVDLDQGEVAGGWGEPSVMSNECPGAGTD
ncbi:hypothetical protein [Streptomyces sp. NPDC059491]|uniref:hypothetical protein n=1 Tax=Streptomyces sp. NPDC059491 TaxID=3346850 RepID=UPI0036BD6804